MRLGTPTAACNFSASAILWAERGGSSGGALTAQAAISGNSDGIYIASGANVVQGNYVGPTSRDLALGNPMSGSTLPASNLTGGNVAGAGNVISGNGYGVQLDTTGATGNLVQGNKVGTNAGGSAGLGNTSTGIVISQGAQNNLIGVNGADTNAAFEGNVISANGFLGIQVTGTSTSGNVIAGNEIGTNAAGTAALGNVSGGIQVFGAANTRIGTNADGVGDALERNIISPKWRRHLRQCRDANHEPQPGQSAHRGTLQNTTATGSVSQADFMRPARRPGRALVLRQSNSWWRRD